MSIINGIFACITIICLTCIILKILDNKNEQITRILENKEPFTFKTIKTTTQNVPIEIVDKLPVKKKDIGLTRAQLIKNLKDMNLDFNVSDTDKELVKLYNDNNKNYKCVEVFPTDEPKNIKK